MGGDVCELSVCVCVCLHKPPVCGGRGGGYPGLCVCVCVCERVCVCVFPFG